MDVLISGTGALWTPGGHELPRPPLLGPGALEGARRHGTTDYVHIRMLANGAWVRLCRGMLSRAAFERVVWLLVQKQINRAVIDFDDGLSAPELLASLQDIVARLDEVRGQAPGEPPRPSFFLERLALERLDGARRIGLRRALAFWGRARGRIGHADLDREIGSVTNPRMLLRAQPGGRLQMDALTSVLGANPPCERMQLLGRDIDDQPDGRYGAWISEPYRVFMHEDEPSLQLVEVAIPSRSSRQVVRARYERLLLPWQTAGGEKWITTNALVRMRRVVNQ
jgi:hypothetical protein